MKALAAVVLALALAGCSVNVGRDAPAALPGDERIVFSRTLVPGGAPGPAVAQANEGEPALYGSVFLRNWPASGTVTGTWSLDGESVSELRQDVQELTQGRRLRDTWLYFSLRPVGGLPAGAWTLEIALPDGRGVPGTIEVLPLGAASVPLFHEPGQGPKVPAVFREGVAELAARFELRRDGELRVELHRGSALHWNATLALTAGPQEVRIPQPAGFLAGSYTLALVLDGETVRTGGFRVEVP
ncbi:MAG TPA: hypothetical protein VFH47_07150 [Candidatus Thermoplasmatota archaeon]|nr:hypothetical protein [Candidatus Thermoplasmatota archaeon]